MNTLDFMTIERAHAYEEEMEEFLSEYGDYYQFVWNDQYGCPCGAD